jgi:TorA maturation chaperone TorD
MQQMFETTPKDDHSRAQCYGLISSLFYGRADEAFLKHLGAERVQTVAKPGAWELLSLDHDAAPTAYTKAFAALQSACRSLGEQGIRREYEVLFLESGKASVSPFTSRYTAAGDRDRHLDVLRDYLVSCGLVRPGSGLRFEDHVSAVCDVMRWLIEHQRPGREQLAFFNEFVRKSLGAFCDAVELRTASVFYRAVAALARAFIDQELVTLERTCSREQQSA